MPKQTKRITKEQAWRSSMLIGLFDSMIEDIPKAKRRAHYAKLEFLVKKGFIQNFDFGEDYNNISPTPIK